MQQWLCYPSEQNLANAATYKMPPSTVANPRLYISGGASNRWKSAHRVFLQRIFSFCVWTIFAQGKCLCAFLL